MNEINPFDQFNNCQMKNSWAKWNPAPQNDHGIQVKREDNFSYNNLYSYSPSYQEHTSYFEPDRKPQIKQNLHPSCNIPGGQHQMEQPYFYAGGNHQVPEGVDSISFETSPNEFYTEMPKHTLPQVIHGGGDDMYQGAYPNTSHPQIHPISITEGSTSSLPVSITPYTLQTTGSAPPSPSVAFDLESSQYMQSNSSSFEPIMSPFSAGPYQQFTYDDDMSQGTPTRSGKDPKYCERRRKNNEASKKSRAKKKEKAKEMETRAQILEQENRHLRQKYSELEQEVAVYKKLTETINSCDSQECSTTSCLGLQQHMRNEPVRASNAMP